MQISEKLKSSLTSLNFQGNEIGKEGAVAIAQALTVN